MSFVMPSPKFIIASFFIVFFIIVGPKYFLKRIYSVDGGYTEWSGWSLCMRDCGDSLQGRYRNCTNPKPSGFGRDCMEIGSHIETRPCKIRECPISGGLGPWSDWGECDKPCQSGERKRSRKCDNPAAAFGGKVCIDPLEETQKCLHLKPCPINGGFSNWGDFNACSVTCGPGHKTRSRQCNNPVPQFGGENCQGNLQEIADCKEKDCIIPPTSNTTQS